MAEKYQGWKNYDTWYVVVMFNNDATLYWSYREHRPFTAETAKAYAREVRPDGFPSISFDKVDWAEVAKAWNEE